jgi:type II secretory pathway component PulC
MKKNILIFLVALNLVTCPMAFVYGAPQDSGQMQQKADFLDVKTFIYDSQGARDPFTPLLTKDGRPVVTYSRIASVNDVVVEGILYDRQGESVVVINDVILKQGDSISDIKVEKIEKDFVVLSFKGQEHTFKIKE